METNTLLWMLIVICWTGIGLITCIITENQYPGEPYNFWQRSSVVFGWPLLFILYLTIGIKK